MPSSLKKNGHFFQKGAVVSNISWISPSALIWLFRAGGITPTHAALFTGPFCMPCSVHSHLPDLPNKNFVDWSWHWSLLCTPQFKVQHNFACCLQSTKVLSFSLADFFWKCHFVHSPLPWSDMGGCHSLELTGGAGRLQVIPFYFHQEWMNFGCHRRQVLFWMLPFQNKKCWHCMSTPRMKGVRTRRRPAYNVYLLHLRLCISHHDLPLLVEPGRFSNPITLTSSGSIFLSLLFISVPQFNAKNFFSVRGFLLWVTPCRR